MAGRQKVVVTREVLSDEEVAAQRAEERAEVQEANEGVTIFELGDVDERKIDRVHVHRKDPPEGFLAEVEPTITERDIFTRWGGSEYRIEGKNSKGQIARVKTVRIAGDPVFVSEIAETRWRRSNGMRSKDGAPMVAAPPAETLSIKDVFLLMEERDGKRRQEEQARSSEERRGLEEREERRRKDVEERDERRRKDDGEREERRKREDAERMERERKQKAEDDDRRRVQHQQDMERMQAQMTSAMQQQHQMFQSTIEMLKVEASSKKDVDPVGMLVKGVELAMSLKNDSEGGGPQDALTAILSKLPDTLRELRETGQAVASEVAGRKQQLVIRGPLADKLKTAAAKLQANGQDPSKVLDQLATSIIGSDMPAAVSSKPRPVRRKISSKPKPAPVPARPITPQGPRAVG